MERTNKKEEKIIAYTDGGSRGNPGPAAIGVYFPELEKRYGEFIQTATNNIAEYKAIVYALKKAKQLVGSKRAELSIIEIRSDSQLVVNQLSGFFKIKEEELFPFFIHIWNLKQDFAEVRFVHVPREQNKQADALVNEALDEALSNSLGL